MGTERYWIGVVAAAAFVGVIITLVTSLLPSDHRYASILAGFLTAAGIVLIVYLFQSSGSFLGGSLFGTQRALEEDVIQSMQAEGMLEKAAAARRSGDLEKTLEILQQQILEPGEKVPERTAFWIAQIYEDPLGNLKEAIYWYRKTIALACRRVSAGNNFFARESQQSLDRLNFLIGSKKESVVDDLMEVKQFIETEDFDKARTRLGDLQQIYPENAEVDYLYGHYYRTQNNLGMACELFRQSLEKDPGHLLAAYYRAFMQFHQDRYLEARESYQFYLNLAAQESEEAQRIEEAKKKLEHIEQELASTLSV